MRVEGFKLNWLCWFKYHWHGVYGLVNARWTDYKLWPCRIAHRRAIWEGNLEMNWFVVTVSIMYSGAFLWDLSQEKYLTAIIWLGYSVSGFALAKLGGV